MKNHFPFLVVVLCLSALSLSSCVGLAVGGAAATGVAAASEGGLKGEYRDLKIQAQINDEWLRSDTDMFRKLDLTVTQGRVLITGVVQDPEQRVEAVRLAWKPKNVAQVINEIQVAESKGVTGYARDAWISTKIRTAITISGGVQSLNYTIDTVHGTVYLMGVAQNQIELDEVIETARNTSGAKQVVSYVKLAGVDQAVGADEW